MVIIVGVRSSLFVLEPQNEQELLTMTAVRINVRSPHRGQFRNQNKLSPPVSAIASSSISHRHHVTSIITDHVTQGALCVSHQFPLQDGVMTGTSAIYVRRSFDGAGFVKRPGFDLRSAPVSLMDFISVLNLSRSGNLSLFLRSYGLTFNLKNSYNLISK